MYPIWKDEIMKTRVREVNFVFIVILIKHHSDNKMSIRSFYLFLHSKIYVGTYIFVKVKHSSENFLNVIECTLTTAYTAMTKLYY